MFLPTPENKPKTGSSPALHQIAHYWEWMFSLNRIAMNKLEDDKHGYFHSSPLKNSDNFKSVSLDDVTCCKTICSYAMCYFPNPVIVGQTNTYFYNESYMPNH